MYRSFAFIPSLLSVVRGQQACSLTAETHPPLKWSQCTSAGSCTDQSGSLTVDGNWRWLHSVKNSTNCYTGNTWDAALCPDAKTCAENCCLDGADYSSTYGVTTSADAATLSFVTNGPYSTNVGSRLYLMAGEDKYQMFHLIGQEFTFDVDVSNVPCGLDAALYFVSMPEDGGMGLGDNKAGAKYGTGYCDAQCPRDLKFIEGEANCVDWKPSSNDKNAGVGVHGSCCPEVDVWEANSISTAYTLHSCDTPNATICNGDDCGGTYSTTRYAGTCDADGCDYNPYRVGDKTFYGKGQTVDTSSKFTVVTQFVGSGSTLSEVRRFYVQNGKVIPNSVAKMGDSSFSGNSINQDYCDAENKWTGDKYSFKDHGGFSSVSKAMAEGMVLVLSLWDDHEANMLWLDSTYATKNSASDSSAARGTCDVKTGAPADVESASASAKVIYPAIKIGPINSTYSTS